MSDRGNDACWASCNVLLVLGILPTENARARNHNDTERQCDHTLPGMRATCTPLLHRLEERGDIRSRERMNGGRPRRWYRLTRQGTKTLARCRREWGITAANAAVWPQEVRPVHEDERLAAFSRRGLRSAVLAAPPPPRAPRAG